MSPKQTGGWNGRYQEIRGHPVCIDGVGGGVAGVCSGSGCGSRGGGRGRHRGNRGDRAEARSERPVGSDRDFRVFGDRDSGTRCRQRQPAGGDRAQRLARFQRAFLRLDRGSRSIDPRHRFQRLRVQHRSGRRHLYRRRLSRPLGRCEPGFARHRADRNSQRSARHAVRAQHHRRCGLGRHQGTGQGVFGPGRFHDRAVRSDAGSWRDQRAAFRQPVFLGLVRHQVARRLWQAAPVSWPADRKLHALHRLSHHRLRCAAPRRGRGQPHLPRQA